MSVNCKVKSGSQFSICYMAPHCAVIELIDVWFKDQKGSLTSWIKKMIFFFWISRYRKTYKNRWFPRIYAPNRILKGPIFKATLKTFLALCYMNHIHIGKIPLLLGVGFFLFVCFCSLHHNISFLVFSSSSPSLPPSFFLFSHKYMISCIDNSFLYWRTFLALFSMQQWSLADYFNTYRILP